MLARMDRKPKKELRRGWTTGACATAAVKAALAELWGDGPCDDGPCDSVTITLPKGERPVFAVTHRRAGPGWAEAGIIKDAGDDPDVTHGALVIARVEAGSEPGLRFVAGEGVGTVTRPGLPIAPGEPAINPVPRAMIDEVVAQSAAATARAPDLVVTISIPGGEALAEKTWNPRLGIVGGLSILGTTGIVRPFSCAAWIASIHRGIDVARAEGQRHVAGCTGSTSEATVQALTGLPDYAMLDMGDFVGGVVKYLCKHPVDRLTIGGGIGKLTKLAQGAVDLHSGRSQVDFGQLAGLVGDSRVRGANTVLEAYEMVGAPLAEAVAKAALARLGKMLGDAPITPDVVIVGRDGAVLARAA